MADDTKIVQEIELQGADQVVSQFGKMGDASQAGMAKVEQSAKSASAALEGIGASSAKATQEVAKTSTEAVAHSGAIAAAAKRVGISYDEMAARIKNSGGAVRSFGATATQAMAAPVKSVSAFSRALDFLGGTFREAKRDAQGMSQANADVGAGLGRLNDSSDQAAGGIGKLETFAIRAGSSLRLLGRAAQIRELSQLGRGIAVLGRAFAFGAPLLFAAALEKIASSAAESADKISDLSARAKLTTDQFQEVTSAFVGVGKTAEDAGTATKGLADVIKQTDENVRHNADSFAQLQFTIKEARKAAVDLASDYVHSLEVTRRAFRDFNDHVRDVMVSNAQSSRDFTRSLKEIDQELADLDRGPLSEAERKERRRAQLQEQRKELEHRRSEELIKQSREQIKLVEQRADLERNASEQIRKGAEAQEAADKHIRDSEKALRDARAEADRHATVLEKLGITALDATGKLKKTPEVLEDIAAKLANVNDPAKVLAIDAELIAAGIDRTMIPALRRGTQGFHDLIEEGKRIRPVFTTPQLEVADQFLIRLNQVTQAFGSLKDAIGLAVSPIFIPFFEKVRDTIISVRAPVTAFFTELAQRIKEAGPQIQQFGAILGQSFVGILKAIGVAFTEILIPAFEGIKKAAAEFAEFLNRQLGGKAFNATNILLIAVGALAVAFGGLPLVIGAVTIAIGFLISKFENNKALAVGLAVALGILIIAFASWPVIIAAVVVAIGFLITKWDDFKRLALQAMGALRQKWDEFWTFLDQKATGFVQFFKDLWQDMIKFVQKEWDAFIQFFKDLWDGAVSFAQRKADEFAGWFKTTWVGKMVGGIQEVIAWIEKLIGAEDAASSNFDSGIGAAAGVAGFSRGGHVRGPGTTRSDSIWARLSNREFVMQAPAVSHWGLPFMHAINRMSKLPGFSMGGLVQTMAQPTLIPRFAGGGAVDTGGGGGRPIVLNIGGESFDLISRDQKTADELGRFVNKSRLTSAGRKPTYWGAE